MLVVVGAHENGNMTGLVVDVTCQSWTYSPPHSGRQRRREALSQLIMVGRVVLHALVQMIWQLCTIPNHSYQLLRERPELRPVDKSVTKVVPTPFQDPPLPQQQSNSLCLLSYLAKLLNNATENLGIEVCHLRNMNDYNTHNDIH